MPYCPKCNREYADTVETCVECRKRLRPGHRPIHTSLEFDDYLVPLGSFICGALALLMLFLRHSADVGSIQGPIAQALIAGQPPGVTVFYGAIVIISTIVLCIWFVLIVVLRR